MMMRTGILTDARDLPDLACCAWCGSAVLFLPPGGDCWPRDHCTTDWVWDYYTNRTQHSYIDRVVNNNCTYVIVSRYCTTLQWRNTLNIMYSSSQEYLHLYYDMSCYNMKYKLNNIYISQIDQILS